MNRWCITFYRQESSERHGCVEDYSIVVAPTAKDALTMFEVNTSLKFANDDYFNGPRSIEYVVEEGGVE